MLVGPIFMVYPGIVWKDVHYAHFALCGFALIGIARERKSILIEYFAIGLLAFAATQRQQGLVVAVLGSVWAGWSYAGAVGFKQRTLASLSRLALTVGVLIFASVVMSFISKSNGLTNPRTGITQCLIYDMAGAVHRAPDATLDVFAREKLDVAFRRDALATYDPSRIDTLGPGTGLAHLKRDNLAVEQWLALAWSQPRALFGHKLEFMAWFGGLRDQLKCAPVHVGHGPSAELLRAADLQDSRPSPLAPHAYAYSKQFFNTPYFALWSYALVTTLSLCLLGFQRRWRSPWFGLQLCALAYVSSFALLGLACDFRYGYFLVVTGSLSAVYMLASGFGFRLRKEAPKP